MGKNRKSKQVTSQSSQSDFEENGGREASVKSLSSNNFKVEKNADQRTSDEQKDFLNPRSELDSGCDTKASVCNSNDFWTNKSNGNNDTVTVADDANPTNEIDGKIKLQLSDYESHISDSEDEKLLKSCSKTCGEQKIFEKNICDIDKTLNCESCTSILVDSYESTSHESIKTQCANTVNSSLDSEVKTQKKKKKQKPKKLEAVNSSDNAGVYHHTTTSSESSPIECPYISLGGADCREKNMTQKEIEKQSDRKRPSKKQLAAIHEALNKAKEDEERRKKDEEEKKKLIEETERLKLEQEKREQEKKEKKKLKEKLRKERLKAEGRLLSKSQKQARARMQATIEIYRQQGVDIPQIGEKITRTDRVGSYKSTSRRRFDSTQSEQSDSSKSTRHKTESFSSQESKDSIIDIPSSFESKDSVELFSADSLTAESDAGHFSCSEDSDALDDDNHVHLHKLIVPELETSSKKVNLTKIKTENTQLIKISEGEKMEKSLRSPVVCVLGHVDTGKTKLLDYIRRTHVQDSEAGGITQQIGATMIPQSALKDKCKMVKKFSSFKIDIPGLLVIDTPGHESFRNLRSRGTSLCDIAILVVDIMHGLEAQTLESINLLKEHKIPFVVALNKVDRIYGWKSDKDMDIIDIVKSQNETALWDFKKRCQDVVLQFAKECLNAALFYENPDCRSFISMVPTSAISGDGMGNILSLITQLTQTHMHKQLLFSNDLKATVLEVKTIPGLGTTIDVILVNGQLHEGDSIVLVGQDGPIITQIRSLLMPHPLKELRVKNPYVDYKVIKGAQGIKISGKDLDKTLAGMPLFVAKNSGEIDALKTKVSDILNQTINSIKISERGVYVQASTLGSLEALLDYLTSAEIPYFSVKIGPVVKKDVMKASIMLEHDIQYATILAFDVKIDKDAQELADHLGVKILHADIIYHLFDMFIEHRENYLKKLEEKKHLAIFPCILTVLKDVSKKDGPTIVLHVLVEAGTLKLTTPLCVPKRCNLDIGTVSDIQVNGVSVTSVNEGQNAVITVFDEHQKQLELESDDNLVSHLTRQSIEVLKEYCRDELCPSDWHLVSELKKVLHPA